jgi:hypothetical protein
MNKFKSIGWLLITLFLMMILASPIGAQLPPEPVLPEPLANDFCENAIEIIPGEHLTGLSNELATLGPREQIPADEPYTCIESYENDMWFKFTTVSGIAYYEIVITTNECNSPAGLQAILIQGNDCNATQFIYKACSNKETMDTVALFLHEPSPGVDFFIYVDGFDGAICNYNLSLNAAKAQKLTQTDYVRMKWDYELPDEGDYVPANQNHEYMNNRFTLRWSASHGEDIAFFLIEQVDLEIDPNRGSINGIVDARTTVSGEDEEYSYTVPGMFIQNGQYCYRIVSVTHSGERHYSDNICFEAYVIRSFFMNEVIKTDVPGIYSVSYMNNQKKVDYTFKVLDDKRNIVKEMKLENEPIRDGKVTVDMTKFPPGKYYFIMENGVEMFRREFIVTGE